MARCPSPARSTHDHATRVVNTADPLDLRPLAGLEILVVGEKVLHPLELDRLHVGDVVHVVVHGGKLVVWDGQHLLVGAAVVLHEQDAERPAADHRAGHHRSRIHDDDVQRIAIAAQRMRHEPIIAGVAHRRIKEAIDEQRTRRFVDLVLDRLAPQWHLNDHIDVVGRGVPDRDGVDSHRGSPRCRRVLAYPAPRLQGIVAQPDLCPASGVHLAP